MGVSGHGILIEIVGDEKSYLRAAERTIGVNTKLDASFTRVGVGAGLSADAQIKAAVRAQEALRVNASMLSQRAASLPAGSREGAAATLLAAEAQTKYARSIGVTATSARALSGASQTAERDMNKTVRGALAGTGVFSKLGRSLAFASSGFIAVAVGSQLVTRSISAAEQLAKAQASLDVAIKHTGGSVTDLGPKYRATAREAERFGQSEVDALTALARATVLTGDAASAQRAYREALVISKATGKDFDQVLVATSKAQEGETASLRRYGILVATTSTGQQQYAQVMKRFSGQAAANTTESDRLGASVANFEAILGTALLPTFDRLAGRLTDWLSGMEKSGRLQKDVNGIVTEAGDVFHTLGRVIGVVDRVTGGFAHTMELLVGLKFASVVGGWVGNLGRLEAAWGGVTVAAEGATAAETAGAAGVAGRVGLYTGAGAAAGAAAAGTEKAAAGAIAADALKKLTIVGLVAAVLVAQKQQIADGLARAARGVGAQGGQEPSFTDLFVHPVRSFEYSPAIHDQEVAAAARVSNAIAALVNAQLAEDIRRATKDDPFGAADLFRGSILFLTGRGNPTSTSSALFGGLKPETQFTKTFALNQAEQLAQAQAALTRTTTDDVAGAHELVARIKRLIDQGRLHGNALIQALGLEASAMSTIWSAEDAAAQTRAAAAQAAKDRIAQQIQNSIDPIRLEVALSRAQALGKPLAAYLRRLRAAAEAALASGKLNLDQQKQAWDQITSLNGQLNSQTASALGDFKQAKTRELTAGLGLTERQRAELRARLSQLGPGRTRPSHGTGAYGYEIGGSGRPTVIHTHVHIDKNEIGSAVTKVQQKRNRRNSSQRRGPNA